jgi:hypothetical protein
MPPTDEQTEQLYRQLCADQAAEPDPVTRYLRLTWEQELYDALVSRIKRARGEALVEVKAARPELSEQAIAEMVGLKTRQRVQQLINPDAKKR